MAIHLPSNLYSEGQAAVNSNAFTQFYLQEKSKQRARKDAYDAYYRDLGKGLSPAGMAANDIPDFMNKIQGWKQYTIQNRDVLNDPRNPKYGEAVTEAQYLYNDALEHAETSKTKVKDLYQFKTLYRPGMPFTDATYQMLDAAGKPISNGYKPLDFSHAEYDEKPYDFIAQQKDIDAALKGVQLGKTVTNIKPDPRTHTNTVTYDFQYNKDALNDIAQRAAAAYQTNPKVKKWLDNQVTDKAQYDALNPTFQQAFGRDIQSGEDKYAAMLLMNAKQAHQQQAVTGFNPYLGQGGSGSSKQNPAELWSQSIVQAGNIAAQTGDVTQLRNVASQLFSGNGSRRLGNKAEDVKYETVNGRPAIQLTTYPITDAERDKEYDIKAQAVKDGKLKKEALNVDGLTSTFYLDEGTPQLLSKLGGLWQQTMSSDTKAETPQYYNMPATQVPPKQTQKAVATTNKTYDVSGKKYTHADLLKLGYTEEQIKEAIKLGTIKE